MEITIGTLIFCRHLGCCVLILRLEFTSKARLILDLSEKMFHLKFYRSIDFPLNNFGNKSSSQFVSSATAAIPPIPPDPLNHLEERNKDVFLKII